MPADYGQGGAVPFGQATVEPWGTMTVFGWLGGGDPLPTLELHAARDNRHRQLHKRAWALLAQRAPPNEVFDDSVTVISFRLFLIRIIKLQCISRYFVPCGDLLNRVLLIILNLFGQGRSLNNRIFAMPLCWMGVATKFLDHHAAERRKVARFAAGNQPSVDDDFFVDPLRPGVAQIGLQ